MAGSGWCHHPLRKTTNELLIMVRRAELACRDQWSHSLWEEGSWEPATLPPDAGLGDDASVAGRPLLPATEHDIAALLRAERAERPLVPSAVPHEDVVLGEARLVTDRTPPWRKEEQAPEPRRDYDPRTAIKRAREAYRERMRAQEAERAALAEAAPMALGRSADLVDATPMVVDEPDSPDVAVNGHHLPDRDEDAPAAVRSTESQAELEDVAAIDPVPRAVDSAATDATLGVDSAVDPDEADDEANWWTAVDAGPDAPFAQWTEPGPDEVWAAVDPAPVPSAPHEEAPTPATPVATWIRDEPAPPPAGVVASSPWSVASATATAVSSSDPIGEPRDGSNGNAGWTQDEDAGASAVSWWGEENEPDPPPRDAWAGGQDDVASDPVATAVPDDDAGPGAALAVESPPAQPVIQLLPVGAVAPGVPRICRTCRDYRPAEGGDRGWCANQWAFTTRQLVHPDDPAPCESSAGSWWLPTDDLCLADADVSTHGQPTPHLDRWLPHHRERVAERKRS